MTVVTKTKFVPIPDGVYNLKVVKYESKEQKAQPGSYYYQWTIQVLDVLPEEFIGKDTFGVITSMDLTENNNLSKFLANVGVTVEVGEDLDLDTLINYKFVGKVITVKNKKNGQDNNGLGQLTIPEYERFNARNKQGSSTAKSVQRRVAIQTEEPVETEQPEEAPAPAPVRQAQPAARPAARPTARPVAAQAATPVARSVARPTARVSQQPIEVAEEGTGSDEDFPEQA